MVGSSFPKRRLQAAGGAALHPRLYALLSEQRRGLPPQAAVDTGDLRVVRVLREGAGIGRWVARVLLQAAEARRP